MGNYAITTGTIACPQKVVVYGPEGVGKTSLLACFPDVLFIDGGSVHASVVERQLADMGLTIPVFGMVKDNRHRTRALVRSDGLEIGISGQPAVFSLVGRIQEETHRFAITYNRTLRSRRVQGSELDEIPGIGPKRRSDLLKHFKSMRQIREASVAQLQAVLPRQAAQAVYAHYHPQGTEESPEGASS